MYTDGGALIVSPTDLTKFLSCSHLTAQDLAVVRHARPKPSAEPDEALELLFRKGLEHEYRYLDRLRAAHQVTEIAQGDLRQAGLDTEAAMAAGAEVVYQATFTTADGAVGQRGHADFLLRAPGESALGDYFYEVADTKLARRLKVPALLQMAEYGAHLHRLQGRPPRWLTVVAGDGVEHAFRYTDVEAYYRRVRGRLGAFLADPDLPRHTVAEPVQHCGQCRWLASCTGGWRRADHLSLVAFMRTDHRRTLEASGVMTVAELAGADADSLPHAIGRASRQRLVQQAALQVRERETGVPVYALLDPEPGLGLCRLPTPDPGDLYLDFEGDPYVEPAGREYLAGLGDRRGGFEAFWAHSALQERLLTIDLVDRLLAQWRAHPGMHVYHYAPYEKSALQRLTARHGVREAELDILLRAEVLVDLYAVVRQGVRISKESYSIKKLEAYYWGHIRGHGADGGNETASGGTGGSDVADAMSSVVAYERWLIADDGLPGPADSEVLRQILAYNADDVRSTLALHDWLEQRRDELAAVINSVLPRPTTEADTDASPKDDELAEQQLAQSLLDAGEDLLAGMVGWHRREARPAWWEVFRLADLDVEDLIEDSAALGGLGAPTWVRDVARSNVHRYPFPPQDTKIRAGRDAALDVDTHISAGTVEAISPEEGWIELRIGKRREPPLIRGLGPSGPMNDGVLRASIARSAQLALTGGESLALRLLRRQVPNALVTPRDVLRTEVPAAAVKRIGSELNGTVLAVQGPPGTGKSTAAAELIRSLLDAGLRVGVTALSHAVIGTLLAKVDRPALHKCSQEQWGGHPNVEWCDSNTDAADALGAGRHRLVGGTAWLFARAEFTDAVDVLVVDEAGQFSLANAIAVAPAATSMVLLGDPQQLAQPSQAEHPYGAGVSALEHLLEGHDTVPPDRGIFLDTTWRMHPDVTEFVSITSYENRLAAAEGLDRQRVLGTGRWDGSGLRWLAAEHSNNESDSAEEAAAICGIITELLCGHWVDQAGVQRPITPDQILVVAPYNAQVARIRAKLDETDATGPTVPGVGPTVPDAGAAAVRVGTVDKFQGREAAVVIYSLASSSAEDAPRGVDFLYDVHRLNVAVSRARALCILVGSPRLLDAEVHTPSQLRAVNALCRYVESAGN